ncbi:hypothetical protein [Streptomyces sp. NPDC055058]
MITHADEGPEFAPDDPLAVLLRPSGDHLGPPPGRFEEIRRAAARRRLVRAAAGAGLACGAALLIALPLQQTAHDGPASPTVPLAPPPVSSTSPTPPSPEPAVTRPTEQPPTVGPEAPAPSTGHPGTAGPRVPSPSATPVPGTLPTP